MENRFRERRTMRVEQVENKNQFSIEHDGSRWFQSYDSLIARWDGATLTLGRDWDYSKTTLKHLYICLARAVHTTWLDGLEDSPNKKAFIQRLIALNKIKLNKEMY
jgi:hypothetical protein